MVHLHCQVASGLMIFVFDFVIPIVFVFVIVFMLVIVESEEGDKKVPGLALTPV